MKFDPKKTIYLIDGSSFLYRAYYGTRPLHTSQGMPVNAIYSFCRMIKKLIDKDKPAYMAIVWDAKGPTVRHETFAEYKATRQAPPSDLFDQKEYIVQFANDIGLHQLEKQGYEADDLMYAIAKEQIPQGKNVVFITSDKDMGQALTLNTPEAQIYLYDAFKDEILDAFKLEEKFEFPVDRLPIYFALLGDASDNIPGVRGIGKKTAQELAQKFTSLEQLYENIDSITKPRTKSALLEHKGNAFLSRDLFLLKYVSTHITLNDLAFDADNWVNAYPLFKELQFNSLVSDAGLTKEQKEKLFDKKIEFLKKYDFSAITTESQLNALAAQLITSKAFAVDTETDGLQPLETKMVGLSVCTQEGSAYYIPCGHKTDQPQLSLEKIRAILAPIFADSAIKKYLHNAKFDMHVLASHGMPLQGVAFDSLIAASLVTKDWQRIGLKQLSSYYFNEEMLTFDELVKMHKLKDFSYVPLDIAALYASFDAHQTFRLYALFSKELMDQQMERIFYDIEMPLMFVLYEMEKRGIYCDRSVLDLLHEQVGNALERVERDILSLVMVGKKKINLNSPKQVEDLLFTQLKLPPQKKSTKRTGYSTDQEVLEALAPMHPVPGLILKYRELSKLKNTYIDALPAYINPKDNAVHTTFSQTRVATGRLASFDPNLQNVPAAGPGLHVRKAFKAPEGYLFISADYSQIELRVLAHLSGDENLKNAFLQGHDIHSETAARLFDIPLAGVSHEQRQIGKRINFSVLYGLTPYGLSKDLNIPFGEAKRYIETYFAQYPKVRDWMEQVIEDCERDGYVTTLWGRRRYIPGIYEKNKTLQEEAKRVAVNTVAQGTAAEIMKIGMIQLAPQLANLDAHILLQIHDELVICAPESQAQKVQSKIQSTLEGVVDWQVPLGVALRSGHNWMAVSK